MFSAYPYRFVMNELSHDEYIIRTSIYTFRSTKSNLVYLVRVEHYKMDIYIIKFYLKSNQNSPLKYNLLTNTFEPRRIINTCISILMENSVKTLVPHLDLLVLIELVKMRLIRKDIMYIRR